jgi:hypothetical protein
MEARRPPLSLPATDTGKRNGNVDEGKEGLVALAKITKRTQEVL